MRIWLLSALVASVKLLPLLLAIIILPGLAFMPQTETHSFKLPFQGHEMLVEGQPAYSYGTEWIIDIPAPDAMPSSVDIWELSTYVYKYIAFNLSNTDPLVGVFQNPDWFTTFTLEGVELGTIVGGHADYGFVVSPQEVFWGPERPKVTERVRGSVKHAGGWPSPTGAPTWSLRVTVVSHFDFRSTGATVFGQFLRQRMKGKVTYTY